MNMNTNMIHSTSTQHHSTDDSQSIKHSTNPNTDTSTHAHAHTHAHIPNNSFPLPHSVVTPSIHIYSHEAAGTVNNDNDKHKNKMNNNADDDDDCSELMPRHLPIPIPIQKTPMPTPLQSTSKIILHSNSGTGTGIHNHHQQQQQRQQQKRQQQQQQPLSSSSASIISNPNPSQENCSHGNGRDNRRISVMIAELRNNIKFLGNRHAEEFMTILHSLQEKSVSHNTDDHDANVDVDSFLSGLSSALCLALGGYAAEAEAEAETIHNDHSKPKQELLHQENQHLRTILRDLGCASLIPPSAFGAHGYGYKKGGDADGDGDGDASTTSQFSHSYVNNFNEKHGQHDSYPHSYQHPHLYSQQNLNHNYQHNQHQHQHHLNSMHNIRTTNNYSALEMETKQQYEASAHANANTNAHASSQMAIAEMTMEMEREQFHQVCQSHTDAILNMQTENSRLNSDIEILSLKLQDEIDRSNLLQSDIHALHSTKNELWKDVNQSIQDKRQLESEVSRSERMVNGLQREVQLKVNENEQLMGNMDALENDLQRRTMQVAALEDEKEKVCVELCNLKKSMEVLSTDNMRLERDLNSARMNSTMISQKTLELQQMAVKGQNDASAYEHMVVELEEERDRCYNMIEEERAKINELEEALYDSKSREHTASEQIRDLIREKAQVVTKLNEANARLGYSAERTAARTETVIGTSAPKFISANGVHVGVDANLKQTRLFSPSRIMPSDEKNTKAYYQDTGNCTLSLTPAKLHSAPAPLRKSGKSSIENKQKAVENSLRELENDILVDLSLHEKNNRKFGGFDEKENKNPNDFFISNNLSSLPDLRSPPGWR